MQTCLHSKLHVALIMDGNGRWATARGLARTAGHQAGIEAVRRVVGAAPEQGIGTLTLYAFSVDNWSRPPTEVAALMSLMRHFLTRETRRLVANGVRLSVVGRRDRLPRGLPEAIRRAEAATAGVDNLHLRIAVDYSARDAILNAARLAAREGDLTRTGISQRLCPSQTPEVDFLIRTGGEQRLSDFLLWESAYAELHFTACPWPEFGAGELAAAMAAFRCRERRFGGLIDAAAA